MNENHFILLKELSRNATLSQRDLSTKLGLSLGKINYVLNALMGKGLLKVEKFKNSKNKLAYMYILTPEGIKRKMDLTCHFLQRKMEEHNALATEIKEMKEELGI